VSATPNPGIAGVVTGDVGAVVSDGDTTGVVVGIGVAV